MSAISPLTDFMSAISPLTDFIEMERPDRYKRLTGEAPPMRNCLKIVTLEVDTRWRSHFSGDRFTIRSQRS